MKFNGTVTLGELLTAGSFLCAMMYSHLMLRANVKAFMDTLQRHEGKLEDHDERLQEHGERLAALGPERRRSHN